ncbi:hypothetical protein QQS21_006733 [Conoideocrella luteorostrata]|uniref:ARID domain-containing protein n=1 Tax=Conoideocrella luteorostrata TaxID=1105319 RepID=A0AAJ0FXQ2_9HYPO|nr:hypothetical protein QQS21_006733 [Conoideocrella luteorostrata]
MSAWMNDAVPNHNGNGFPHMNDPNAAGAMMDPSAFMANSGQFNPGQFPNQQQMAGMQNGPMRHGSPTYQNQNPNHNQTPNQNPNPNPNQNPVYQTNSVIPSKRPRPREDSVTGSPGHNSGMQPPSRSETPQQQNFPGFQSGGGGAMPQQNPGQFSHLQANGSANASPSPIMGNQMRPGNVPQRVATASPHPFSPGPQQFGGSQTSPIPSEHGTPQPNQYMQNMPPGYNNTGYAQSSSNPRPSPNPSAMAGGGAGGGQMMAQQMGQMPQHMAQMPPNMYQQMQHQMQQHGQQSPHQQPGQQQAQQPGQQRPQGMVDQQKMAAYQMRLHQQLQGNMQMQAQMQAQNMGRGMMPKQQMPGMPNGQIPPGSMRQQPRPMGNINPDQFMKNLTAIMNQRGLPLDLNPVIADRPVNLVALFQMVQSKGGYKSVAAANGWAHIAQGIGLPAQIPTVPPTLKQVYERNLVKFEEVWIAQQKHRMMQQNAGMAGPGTPQKQMPPAQQQMMNQGQMQQQSQQPPHMQHQTPVKPGQTPINGFPTPQPPQQSHTQPSPQQPQQPQHQHQHQQPHQQQQQHQQQQHQQQPQPNANAMPGHRNSMSRSLEPSAPNEFALQSPVHHRPGSVSMDGRQHTPMASVTAEQHMPRMPPKPDDYSPCARELSTFGGVDLHAASLLGAELERWEPNAPSVNELGNTDISALTRSLQCGINGEVRVALDTLATISSSPNQGHFLHLRACDDLVEALVDCAETQLDLLAQHSVQVADEIQLTAYEDVVRACRIERWAVKEVPAFGSDKYELDRAVDRLLCITTILRNVSFPGEQNDNHLVLCDESVVKMLCSIIRFLGTRTMLLRTHSNTLDFMKDVVVLLSNIAGSLEIPGREQAVGLLQFLLSFAPVPGPAIVNDKLNFTPYDPSIHSYLPHAVDSLAKLLARDEPNRGFYKTLFTIDSSSPVGNELLIKAFALAVSPIPDKAKEQLRPITALPLFEARKPFLMQGLLAAEIIATVVPGSEPSTARALLASGNCLAQNLVKLIQELCMLHEKPSPRGGSRAAARKDPELVYIVVVAVSLLRRLAEKARDSSAAGSIGIGELLPHPQMLMDAMMMQSPEWTKDGMLPQLTAVLNLDG